MFHFSFVDGFINKMMSRTNFDCVSMLFCVEVLDLSCLTLLLL